MKCDSQASLLARTLASPCLGREPKARVVTKDVYAKGFGTCNIKNYPISFEKQNEWSFLTLSKSFSNTSTIKGA
jgi:hypothetical protein